MSFHYKCGIRPSDFWKLSLSHTYRSPMGMVNIVFTGAMIALAVRFWKTVPDWVQLLILLGVMLFPVIQPFLVYLRAKNQTLTIPADLELTIDEKGILARTGGQQQQVPWKRVTGLILERNMVIIRIDKNSGYFLPNRTLKGEREALVSFLQKHIKK